MDRIDHKALYQHEHDRLTDELIEAGVPVERRAIQDLIGRRAYENTIEALADRADELRQRAKDARL